LDRRLLLLLLLLLLLFLSSITHLFIGHPIYFFSSGGNVKFVSSSYNSSYPVLGQMAC
jgi:hypothetical protein